MSDLSLPLDIREATGEPAQELHIEEIKMVEINSSIRLQLLLVPKGLMFMRNLIVFIFCLLISSFSDHVTAQQSRWVDPSDRVQWINKLPTQQEFLIVAERLQNNDTNTTPSLPVKKKEAEDILLYGAEMAQKAKELFDEYVANKGIDYASGRSEIFKNGPRLVLLDNDQVKVALINNRTNESTAEFEVVYKQSEPNFYYVVYNHYEEEVQYINGPGRDGKTGVEFHYQENGQGVKSYRQVTSKGVLGPRLEWNNAGELVRAEYLTVSEALFPKLTNPPRR